MAACLRISSAFASIVILSACAATVQGVRPSAGDVGANAQYSACPMQTGNRILLEGTDCSGYGSVYSSADIRITGATTIGAALHLMDPTITVHNY